MYPYPPGSVFSRRGGRERSPPVVDDLRIGQPAGSLSACGNFQFVYPEGWMAKAKCEVDILLWSMRAYIMQRTRRNLLRWTIIDAKVRPLIITKLLRSAICVDFLRDVVLTN